MPSFPTILLLIILSACSSTPKKLPKNAPKALKAPYILLISIDGYRYDYTKMYRPPNIINFLKSGASTAKAFRPSFPSSTFANHLSIITGLLPDHHGIIDNEFYSSKLKKFYSLKNQSTVRDGSFYFGIPFWQLTSDSGILSATYFWPGSNANIHGKYPSYYKQYKLNTPHKDRIEQIEKWLKLPKENRPHFLTLYFRDVDYAGHIYGPNSLETKQAVMKVDYTLGQLFKKLHQLDLPINVFIVSDHGMTLTLPSNQIAYDQVVKQELLNEFTIIDRKAISFFYYKGDPHKKNDTISKVIQKINSIPNLRAYRPEEIPSHLNFSKNERIGDIFLLASPGYIMGQKKNLHNHYGNHGYDPTIGKDMHGIFYAKGPNIKGGTKLGIIDNIHLYPFMAKIMGLTIYHEIDGEVRFFGPLLKR